MEHDELFRDQFGAPEELDAELQDHIFDGRLGKMVHHPLVIQVFYREHMNPMLNQMLRQKQKLVNEYMKERNYEGYVFLHERPYRLEALLEIVTYLKPEDYWNVIKSVYVDTENAYEFHDEWVSLMTSDIPVPDDMKLKSLNTEVTKVYRGFVHSTSKMGISWTTDYDKAVWFARRFARVDSGDKPQVVTGVVHNTNILMCIDQRGESEVVVLPDNVNVRSVKEVGHHE